MSKKPDEVTGYRNFVVDHLENKYDITDLYDVVIALNPANSKFKTLSKTKKHVGDAYRVNIKAMYKFRTEKSAQLFSSLYKNIVNENKSILDCQVNGQKVLLRFKEDMIVEHKSKNVVSEDQEKRVADLIGYREENFLISDIFVKSVDALFNSGIYKKELEPELPVKHRINNKTIFELFEKLVEKNPNKPHTSLHKTTMYQNSIPNDARINDLVLKQIKLAIEDRISPENGALLTNSVFRLSEDHGLKEMIRNDTDIQQSLFRSRKIDPDAVNRDTFVYENPLEEFNIGEDEIKKDISNEINTFRENTINTENKKDYAFRYRV